MGSYGTISFQGIGLYSAKNAVYYHMLHMFSKNDYVEKAIKEDDEYIRYEKKFVTTCGVVKTRLDIIGYNLKRVSNEFKINMDYAKNFENEDYPIELYEMLFRFYDYSEDSIKYNLLKKMTIENYKHAIKCYLQNPSVDLPTGNIILDYIIDFTKDHYGLGFPVQDPLSEIRIILDTLDEHATIEYDLTEIIDNGYAELEGVLSFWDEYNFDTISNKTVILAEGTTDIYVLKKSLNLLYPQFKHLYKFFDFDYVQSPGSTSNLVNLVKGFISSGIKERIIALFDNDTAAYEALSKLDKEKITSNIKIIHLPNLDWAKNYPTLGPTGEVNTDINKLACSIELFLGRNLLEKDGKFIPVQWKGYNSKLGRYQGEILYKKEINNSFRDIIKKAEQVGIENVEHDWEQLKYLWETIFATYND